MLKAFLRYPGPVDFILPCFLALILWGDRFSESWKVVVAVSIVRAIADIFFVNGLLAISQRILMMDLLIVFFVVVYMAIGFDGAFHFWNIVGLYWIALIFSAFLLSVAKWKARRADL